MALSCRTVSYKNSSYADIASRRSFLSVCSGKQCSFRLQYKTNVSYAGVSVMCPGPEAGMEREMLSEGVCDHGSFIVLVAATEVLHEDIGRILERDDMTDVIHLANSSDARKPIVQPLRVI